MENALPRPSKPARLWLEPARVQGGRVVRPATWVILHRGDKRSTGCGEADTDGATRALADYVAGLHVEARQEAPARNKAAAEVPVADVLARYAEYKTDTTPTAEVPAVARPKELLSSVGRLLDFWGEMSLADVNSKNCRRFVVERGTQAGARRDLDNLKAAIKLAVAEGVCRELVEVTLPGKSDPREGFATRKQIAALIRHCYRHRTVQTVHRGPRKGETVVTKKRERQHLVPFVLTALYTASRASRVWRASFVREAGRPWIDLENGIFHRMWRGERETKKRAATIRIPPRLLAHMRRWEAGPLVDGVRKPRRYLVEVRGKPVNPRLALIRAMDDVWGEDHGLVIHSLRHSGVTWLMWAGVPIEEVAEFASMTPEMIRKVYAHAHPDTHRAAGEAFSRGHAGRSRAQGPRTIAKETPVESGNSAERQTR